MFYIKVLKIIFLLLVTRENGYPELVRKVAELENLVDALINVIRIYKIPTPACILESSLIQAKLNAINSNASNDDSADIDMASSSRNNDTQKPGTTDVIGISVSSPDDMATDFNTPQTFPTSATNSICTVQLKNGFPVPVNNPVSVSSSVLVASPGPVSSLVSATVQVNNPVAVNNPVSVNNSVLVNQPSFNIFENTANELVTAAASATPVDLNSECVAGITKGGLATKESQVMLFDTNTPLSQQSGTFISQERQLILSTKNAMDFRNSQGSHIPSTHQTIAPDVGSSLPTESARIQKLDLNGVDSYPVRPPERNLHTIDKLPLVSNIGTTLISHPGTLGEVNSMSQEPTRTSCERDPPVSQNGSYTATVSANSNNGSKVCKDSSVAREASKAPSMQSQMFVMKNLVQPRSKGFNESFIFDQNMNSASAPQNFASKSSVAAMPIEQNKHLSSQMNPKQQTNSFISVFSTLEQPESSINNDIPLTRVGQDLSQKPRTLEDDRYVVSNMERPMQIESHLKLQSIDSAINIQANNAGLIPGTEMNQSFQISRQMLETPLPTSMQTCHSVRSLLTNTNNQPAELQSLSTNISDLESRKNIGIIRPLNTTPVDPTTKPSNKPALKLSGSTSRKRSPTETHANHFESESEIEKLATEITPSTSISHLKAPPKRVKRMGSQRSLQTVNAGSSGNASSSSLINSRNRTIRLTEDKNRTKKQPVSSQQATHKTKVSSSLPRPHSVVSLAKSQHSKTGENQRRKQRLSEFSAESLLRNAPVVTHAQASLNQDMTLPTILNIFAPASVGNINPMSSLSTVNNLQAQSTTPVVNIALPTIQSTFSNFSAEALIGGSVDNQQNLNNPFNPMQHSNDSILVQQENQNLFTDFSTDTLLAGTESSLSYGIDSIMSRSESSVVNSCISPNWLQTCPLIDNSPIRNSFNPGFNIFDCASAPVSHVSAVSNGNFATPIKWRPDHIRTDESLHKATSNTNANIWLPGSFNTPQKALQKSPAKNRQRNTMMKGHQNNKRGPSYGDFLLVDSTS